jgi:hypothetical protein
VSTRVDVRKKVRGIRTSMVCALLALGLPASAWALILDAGDGQGNMTAPPEDPGWANVGRRLGGPTVVYLGHGWVLTANHVGAGIVIFDDERYDPIKDSPAQLLNEDGSSTDLLLFRIKDPPDLHPLLIASRPPGLGEEVILIGAGYSRGNPLTFDRPGYGLQDGWEWAVPRAKRWGTNTVVSDPEFIEHGETRTLATTMIFERIDAPTGTRQEAHAAEGDSGGALFARATPFDSNAPFALAGVLFSVSHLQDQPGRSAFYGNVTHAADLSDYRGQIFALAPELDTRTDLARAGTNAGKASWYAFATPPLQPRNRWMGAGLAAACLTVLTSIVWLARRRRQR